MLLYYIFTHIEEKYLLYSTTYKPSTLTKHTYKKSKGKTRHALNPKPQSIIRINPLKNNTQLLHF